jgi:hypothetical protein
MVHLVDLISILLLIGALFAFAAGLFVLADRRDLLALYWLVVGLAALRAATQLLRPRTSR